VLIVLTKNTTRTKNINSVLGTLDLTMLAELNYTVSITK